MSSSPLETALTYAARGIPVFPCNQEDKKPLTAHGFKSATTDPDQIRRWWAACPTAMIGIPTGAPTGLFVLDVDVDKETGETIGEETLAKLGLDPGPGIRARTASGGWHHYYRWPGDGFRLTTGERGGIGRGVDTRGGGGYVIAPGSVNGRGRYEWVGPSLFEADLPDLPQPIARALEDAKARKAAPAERAGVAGRVGDGNSFFDQVKTLALAGLDRWVPRLFPTAVFQPGTGAWRVTSRDLGRDLEEDLSLHPDGINDFGQEEGLTAIEVVMRWGNAATAADAAHWLCDAIGTDPDALGWQQAAPTREKSEKSHLSPAGGVELWPSPDMSLLAPERAAPPPFPGSEVFGECWGNWIAEAAEAKSAPPDYVATALLAVAGSLVGNSYWAAPGPGWTEPPIIWGMLIGNPSAGKSPALDAALSRCC